MSKSTLILFDIDGTILTSGGAGETALKLGFADTFGIEDDLKKVEIAGRTDSGIARQMLTTHGIPVTDVNLERFFNGYLSFLAPQLPKKQGRLLPGIVPLIEALHAKPHVALGLLTGNLERGARLKLEYYGVGQYFEFGAFADDHHDRNQLGNFARERARTIHRVDFPPENIYVLGDTPHDISCARAIGAKAVAIATGAFTSAQLAEHNPDALFEDLSDLNAALMALGV
ncbi:MAG: HAD family hydrolase [Verrucomicrobiota bacterium]